MPLTDTELDRLGTNQCVHWSMPNPYYQVDIGTGVPVNLVISTIEVFFHFWMDLNDVLKINIGLGTTLMFSALNL